MIVLGIDPGLNITGYGFVKYVQGRTTILEAGIIKPKPKDLIQHRLNKVYTILEKLITQHQPQVLVLEKLYSHSSYPTTVGIMGHVRGVICLLCAQKNMELSEQSVKRIRKSVTGQGNASKIQTQRVVAHILGVDPSLLTLDASDALALALGYIQTQGRNYDFPINRKAG